MKRHKSIVLAGLVTLGTVFCEGPVEQAGACGGFFCQSVAINQAGEQIIFRQDGGTVTAVVLIQYVGDAADFSWVVPVPGIPELSTGSDLVFAPLELATRPQFILETIGDACSPPSNPLASPGGGGSAEDSANDNAADDGVDILQQLAVGPYDIQVVTSDDSFAMATWLTDNGYNLSDRGEELISPYVVMDMNFVAVRLQQDQGVGDLQPLIMRYQTDVPMVPIQLTAVAAQPDMGVIVWMVGDSRAVPLNYLHVTPNYTLLNWYAGTLNAYASYQSLITLAMNEAGGQGFATDYAGRDVDIIGQLPGVETYSAELTRLSAIPSDSEFIAELAQGFVFPSDQVFEILRRELPLEDDLEYIYFSRELLEAAFTEQELAAARANVVVALNDGIIVPLEETLAVLSDGDPYMTRLYTTLSAEEMTLDPTFSFNPDLPDQSLDRNALLAVRCSALGTRWTLTLGEGTGRDGEEVINGTGLPPGFSAPVIEQDSIFQAEVLTTSGPGTVVTRKSFNAANVVNAEVAGFEPGACGASSGLCGAGTMGMLWLTAVGLRLMRGSKRRSI